MQAIVTKYLGPTNTRGSRVKATCNAGSVTVSWDHALNIDENHEAAFRALVDKLGWQAYGPWNHGGLPNNGGRVFVGAGRNAMYVVAGTDGDK